eukprot:Gb_04069 [translate_table: standard]
MKILVEKVSKAHGGKENDRGKGRFILGKKGHTGKSRLCERGVPLKMSAEELLNVISIGIRKTTLVGDESFKRRDDALLLFTRTTMCRNFGQAAHPPSGIHSRNDLQATLRGEPFFGCTSHGGFGPLYGADLEDREPMMAEWLEPKDS